MRNCVPMCGLGELEPVQVWVDSRRWAGGRKPGYGNTTSKSEHQPPATHTATPCRIPVPCSTVSAAVGVRRPRPDRARRCRSPRSPAADAAGRFQAVHRKGRRSLLRHGTDPRRHVHDGQPGHRERPLARRGAAIQVQGQPVLDGQGRNDLGPLRPLLEGREHHRGRQAARRRRS